MIPVLKPSIDDQTIRELNEVLQSGWWGFGKITQEFEQKFAKYVEAEYCIGTNSGTSALDLCLKAHGIKGGELITSPMTFVSDAIVGEWNGMDVTFADIDPDTLCIDPKAIKITPETKAIIAIDSHGRLADIQGIRKVCKDAGREDILIIEDAAHACYTPGAGEHADITIWSFQAVKTLPMWDGGAVTTNDESIYKKLRTLTWLGVEKSTYDRNVGKKYTWDYDITQADGIKAYMTDVQAVVGIGQLRRLGSMTQNRRIIQLKYNEAFANIPQIKIPVFSNTVQYYTMECENRDKLAEFLAHNSIATSVHFKPLSEMTYWKKAVKNPIPETDKVWKKLLTIPCYDELSNEQVDYIISMVKKFYE